MKESFSVYMLRMFDIPVDHQQTGPVVGYGFTISFHFHPVPTLSK